MKNRTEVSMCCKADLIESWRGQDGEIETYTCAKCNEECETDLIEKKSIMELFEDIQKLTEKLDTDWKDFKEQNTKFEKAILELHKPND